MTPRFSIITVTWNAETALAATAASIREQDFEDYEWLVIDGASTDKTLDVARRFADADRDTIVSEADRGVYDAMNKGLSRAKGEIVHFLNAGDVYPDAKVLSDVSADFQSDVDVVYGDSLFSLPDGRIIVRKADDVAAGMHRRVPICHQAMFVRRSCHLKHKFDLSFNISADYAVMAALYRDNAKFHNTKRLLNKNTIEPAAVSIKGRKQIAVESFRIQREILGNTLLSACYSYLRKRTVAFGVTVLQSLPEMLFEKLPEPIRRRIY